MKKALRRSLSLLLTIAIVFSSAYVGLCEVDFGSFFAIRAKAASNGACGDNLTWSLNDEGTLTISGTGAMEDYESNGAPWYSVKDSITLVVIENGVTTVGKYAFSKCVNLASVELSDTVTAISFGAFHTCESLTEIVLPYGVTNIDGSAFRGCKLLESIVIPDTVSVIGNNAFNGCKTLESVTIPDGVVTIEIYTFHNCISLSSVIIGEGVTSIRSSGFSSCTALTDVHYRGTLSSWENVTIDAGNEYLTNSSSFSVCSFGDWVVTKEPTFSQDGEKLGYCSVCGKVCAKEIIPAHEHSYDYDNYEYVLNPDDEKECVKQHKCIYCDATTLGGETYIAIRTADDLRNIDNDLSGNYVLMNDIDLTEATAEGGKYDFNGNGWKPIGGNKYYSYNSFSGSFNGNGYEISGLNINVSNVPNDTSELRIGLFACVSGTVENLKVFGSVESNLPNNKYVGAITGGANGGTIEYCHAYCSINVSNGYNMVGGIVGLMDNNTTVTRCTNNKTISGEDEVGGIVGRSQNSGTITQCNNIACVYGAFCGGIVGYTWFHLDSESDTVTKFIFTLSECFNTGDLDSTNYCGGLVGCHYVSSEQAGNAVGVENDSLVYKIIDSYNIGSITGMICSGVLGYYDYSYPSSSLASFVAKSYESITNCYNGGQLWGNLSDSAIYNQKEQVNAPNFDNGYNIIDIDVINCFFIKGAGDAELGGTELTKDEMKLTSSFSGFDFTSIWFIEPSTGYPYPQLRDNRHIDAVCQHTYNDWVVDTESTCEADGTKHRVCSTCGEVETEVIPATGHDYSTDWTIDVPATCTTNGSKSYHCLNCGDKTDITVITALGHVVGEWVVTIEPTCSQEGEKIGYCSGCGKACVTDSVPTIEHNYDYDNYEYVINPDNDDEYIKQGSCTNCGATGSDESPYIPIWTIADLYLVTNNLDKNYILMTDIDLTDATSETGDWSYNGLGWDPIGSNEKGFEGTFEGNGHSIIGLRVTEGSPDKSYNCKKFFGLFTINNGCIKNLNMVDVAVSGKVNTYRGTQGGSYPYWESEPTSYVGAICGENNGTIENCSASGIVVAVDLLYCSISGASGINGTYCTREVTHGVVGGLCANNTGVIKYCVNQAEVKGDCYDSGAATIGGISAENDGSIFECYNTGKVHNYFSKTQTSTLGYGVIGGPNYPTVYHAYDCYDVGETKGLKSCKTSYYKKWNDDGGVYSDCNGSTYNLTDVQMKLSPMYSGFDFDNIWFIDDSTGYPYPQLKSNSHIDVVCQHTYSDWVIDTEATCGSDGSKHRTCESCGKTEIEEIPATGHDYSTDWTIDVAATCTTNGSKSHHCNNCGDKADVTEIIAPGHIVGEWVVTTEPTCSQEGEKVGYCAECGEVCATEVVPTTEHNYNYDNYEYVQNPENPDEYHKQYECEDCGSTKLDENSAVIKSLIIESLPDKTTYIEGQAIDTTGLVVKLEFEDGTTEVITDYDIVYDNSVTGEQDVTVSFGNVTASFKVTFTAKNLVSIAVTKMPDKTTYVIGDSFDSTGMVVTATYDNGLTEEITDYTVSALPQNVGKKNLMVSFGGKRVIIQVTVIEKKADSMTVIDPEKFEYVLGDEFDPTGMVVTVAFNNGAVEEVTDYTIEGFGDFIGPGYITLKYENLSYEIAILMHAPADFWIVESESTCTTEGVKHLYCAECGEIARTEIIPATGHDYAETVIKQATCLEEGTKQFDCNHCDSSYTENFGGRHIISSEKITREPTCDVDGIKYGLCSVCGETVGEPIAVPALGHDYSTEFTVDVEATCSQPGSMSRHCSRCDAKTDVTVIENSVHDYTDWVITTPAGCETDGERTRSCTGCGEYFTETITAPGHAYSIIWTTDKTPTCTVDGSKSHHCNRCGDKKDITVIPATGHTFGEWVLLEEATCTVNGQRVRMCSTCYMEDVEILTALGHTYNEWTIDTKADCENDGARHTNCTVCGTVVNETIRAYGHDYQSVFTVDVEATCTDAGSKSHHCSRCESKTDVTVIEPLGHHISTMWTIDKDPTCESEGLKSHHCLRCDCVEDVTTIPVANHIYGKWYVVTPATMDTAGVRAHKCYNCEMTEEAELPKLLKYTATFVADGDVVATVDFPEDATEIEIPEVPHKDKFNGEWENFDIRNKNFTVNAVYTPIPANEVEGIKTGNTADYYASTGEVEVNLNVSAPSRTIVTTTTKTVPLDIVFVLDQSGSMADYGRKDALKSAVRTFSNAILDDAKKYSVDHRIAVVGFASGNNDWLNYENSELLTSEVIKYDKITNEDYKNSLVSVNDNGALNNVITKAINAIDAEGATRADIGLEMATNIFANNPVTDNRQRVVVFLTDGVPTSYSNFEYNVANVAIQNAYQLKNTYDATVYSVGVFDRGTSADSKVNNFMNYVSSNYIEDVVMSKYSKETTENIGGYYLDVSDVSKLSDVFTSIVEETTTHTGRFTKATLKYTLTNNFVLTINQENAIRKDAVEKLGVTNEQISITRNDNGTTTIVISDVEPWASGTNYVIDFTFRATANGNTLKSGTYQVGTFESGVILENGEGYEAVFAPQSVDIGGTSGIAVFNINNLPYAINRLSSTTKVVAPATDFGADYNFIGWNVPNNLTLNNEARVFEAELLKNEYKLSWNIDGEITEVKYAVGDFITVPRVGNNSIGGAFVGWDMDIPETMPSENLTITAIYDAHYHKYDVTKAFESCTEGGTLTYTCECGHTYTEEIAPCEHNWEVITASNNQNAIENAGSRCSVCGIKDSKALRLEGKSTYQMADASYNTATVELDYIDENGDKHQPDGNVEISVQLDEVFSNDIPADATATVYRVNDDGSRTILNSEQKGMQMTFTTDHFSTYEFEFTTGTQKYLFAQPKSRIDYANRVIFSDMRLAREFKDFVSYLAPASVDENANTLGFMGTGSSITLTKDGTNTDYTVVVNGDVNGDSVVDALDAAQVANASNGHKSLDGAYAMAADSNYDDEISIDDYQAIVNKVIA